MTYQLSRNGQLYGPYTLDDLRRYLASGNVLLTDLVKSDSPTDPPADWLPVSQLLSAEPLPPQTFIQPEAPAANPIPGEASAPWTAPPNQPSQSTAPWGSQQSYAAGVIPLTDVLAADRQLLTARDDLADDRASAARAAVRTYRALGGGWNTAVNVATR